MKILVIDSSAPCDLLQGNSLIGYHLFRRLRREHRLTLLCPAHPDSMIDLQDALGDVFDTVHLSPRAEKPSTLLGVVEPALAKSRIPTFGLIDVGAIRSFQRSLRQIVDDGAFDIIHTRLLSMAATTFDIEHPRKLIELVDSETLRSERRAGVDKPRLWSRAVVSRVMEANAVRRFHACTTVSEADSRRIRRLAPHVPVRTIPNGVDTDYFAPVDVAEEPETVVFTGAMSFPPNVAAVLHFYKDILPLIRKEIKTVRLIVAGRDPAPAVARLESDPTVTVTGFVEDIRPAMARASVYLCPMVTGSGIKNKVLEAMAMARPIVSTRLGIEALNAVDGRDILLADGANEFADAVVRLLRDPILRTRIGKSGRRLVLDEYSWDACAAAYDSLYCAMRQRRARVGEARC